MQDEKKASERSAFVGVVEAADASHRGSLRADPRLGPAVLDRLAAAYTVEVSGNVVMPKLYACPSGVSRAPGGGFGGVNDPALPDGGAAGPGR